MTPGATKRGNEKMEVGPNDRFDPERKPPMAAASLAAPGTEAGPCAEPCEHRDCASTRKMADTPCEVCGEPIGYVQRFFRTVDDQPDMWEHLAHAGCWFKKIEDER
jgi:hypothetical protein